MRRFPSLPTIASLLAVALFLALPPAAAAQPDHLRILAGKFQAELDSLVHGFDGVAGAHVIDLVGDREFVVNQALVFPQASAIKIPILLELFRRAEDEPAILRRRVELNEETRTAGSGVLQILTDGGSELSLEDFAIYMIVFSDNWATNVLIDVLGMDAINALSASLGAPDTRLQRMMIRPESSARGDENLSTPRDAATIMARIAGCHLPMSEASCARVKEILSLPKDGPVRAPVPSRVPIAFKPGGITGVSTVWAIVGLEDRPYVLSVMANYGGDGGALVEAISAAAYRYFAKLEGATPYGTRVPVELKRRVSGSGGGR